MGAPAATKPAAVVATTKVDSLALANSRYALVKDDDDVAVAASRACVVPFAFASAAAVSSSFNKGTASVETCRNERSLDEEVEDDDRN